MTSYRPTDELESLVGESCETVEGLEIEAGKVAEYADALRIADPAFRDEDAARDRGFDAVPAPLIHTMSALYDHYQINGGPLYAFDLGMDIRYKLLGEQEYEYERHPVVGDVLSGRTTVEDVWTRKDGEMTFVTLATEYFDADDSLVLTERRTMIETGRADVEDGDD